ncbi:MAG: type VI secretion system baseplate subunit TssG [Chromatiales bacterium]|nr:type VI secretion system baseplate subunit TssG [Chromatiales bacterium]
MFDRAASERAVSTFDFFQALRRIECLLPRTAPHRHAPCARRTSRSGSAQEPSLAFAPATLSAFGPGSEGRPPRLSSSASSGCSGPNGPLPLHLTEYARERHRCNAGDRTFARFLDIFHHRLLALFYRAWAQAQPTVSLDRPRDDRFAAYVGVASSASAAPAGAAAMRSPTMAKLYFAGAAGAPGAQRRRPAGAVPPDFFRRAGARRAVRRPLACALPADDRTAHRRRHGGRGALGVGAVLGGAVWDRQHKFRIDLGPLDAGTVRAASCRAATAIAEAGGAGARNMRSADWDCALGCSAARCRDSARQVGRLGWTTWLGHLAGRLGDAADLTLEVERVLARLRAAAIP